MLPLYVRALTTIYKRFIIKENVQLTTMQNTPILMDLHWLPIGARIDYKTAVLTFKSPTTNQPAYLSELLQAHRPTRMQRSSEQINCLHAVGS
jgi:hypothetical protein